MYLSWVIETRECPNWSAIVLAPRPVSSSKGCHRLPVGVGDDPLVGGALPHLTEVALDVVPVSEPTQRVGEDRANLDQHETVSPFHQQFDQPEGQPKNPDS